LTADPPLWCPDTSAFVNPWNKWYPPDVAPGYWSRHEELARSDRLRVSEEVREELEKVEDDLYAWAKASLDWFPLTEDVQRLVAEIMARYGRLVDTRKNRSRADPFVIATAAVTDAIVITTEEHGTAAKPKIPYVCGELGVPCVNVLEFIRAERIQLGGS